MKQILFGIIVAIFLAPPCDLAAASPAYTFEELLPRAETVFIAPMKNSTFPTVSFEVIETLRGAVQDKSVFGFSELNTFGGSGRPDSFLIISQGDDHFGKPKPVVSFGQLTAGQAGYRGWIAFPITSGNNPRLEFIDTGVGVKPGGKRTGLTLENAKTLIKQIQYKPDINGNH